MLEMCPFVFITEDHNSAEKADLHMMAKQRPTVELRTHSALISNTDGVTEPIGAVQIQNPKEPPQGRRLLQEPTMSFYSGMPNPPDQTGMRIAYERWAQTWSSDDVEPDASDLRGISAQMIAT